MNLSQIIETLPPQVYVRRGELVIHFSTPADLVNRVAETSAALSDLERPADPSRTDGRSIAEEAASSAGMSCRVPRKWTLLVRPRSATNFLTIGI